MKNIISILILVAVVLQFSACKDDPPPKSKIGFATADMDVFESDGTQSSYHPVIGKQLFNSTTTGHTVEIQIDFDRPLAETSIIKFTLAGTATENSSSNPIGDYEVDGNRELLTINKGETSGVIKLKVYEDNDFEYNFNTDEFIETVEIELKEVVSGTAVLGDQTAFTLNISEDDAVVFLDWDSGDGTTGDVDLDAYLSLSGSIVNGSASENDPTNNHNFEAFNIPAGFPNGNYGLSYTYYQGTSDNVTLYSTMYDLGGKLNGGTYIKLSVNGLQFSQKYGQANINPYNGAGNGTTPIIVQTMPKNGFNYSNITDITKPTSGSRSISDLSSLDSEIKLAPIKIERGKALTLRNFLRR